VIQRRIFFNRYLHIGISIGIFTNNKRVSVSKWDDQNGTVVVKFIHDILKLCISRHDEKTIKYPFVDNSRLIEEAVA